MPNDSDESTDNNGHEPKLAEHITGEHLAVLLGVDPTDPLSSAVGDDRARVIVDWQRDTLDHGRYLIDHNTGKPDLDPWVGDVPVIPVDVIAEVLDDHGVAVPTRQKVRAFAKSSGSTDPEIEVLRARHVTDPDLDAAAAPAEKRICGVPETIYNALTDAEREKVLAGRVIAPPQSPTAVARWLARHRFSTRLLLPCEEGSTARRKAWMRKLIRIDQTWYSYDRAAVADPPHWTARTDPEWMRARLRAVLGALWYVKVKTSTFGGVETQTYSLKWWNPDDRNLTQAENALADELAAGCGTHARELPDVYGNRHWAYRGGTRVLVRNGVLDVETGQVSGNTPLWFSLTRVQADYDHTADPYADGMWLRMLRTQWPDDPEAITCLQEWFGYVISGRNDLQKFMWLFGVKGSGKTQITTVLDALVGRTAEIGLDGLNDKWGLEDVYVSGVTLGLINAF